MTERSAPVKFLKSIGTALTHVPFGSAVYDFSLRGHVPTKLLAQPIDSWPGCAENGRWLCGDVLMGASGNNQEPRSDTWEPFGVSESWLEQRHSFIWLRALRSLGGDAGRMQARQMVESWMQRYKNWHPLMWRPDFTGQRVALWLSMYDFFASSAPADFQDAFFDSVIRQARHLSRSLPGGLYGVGLLNGYKGLLYAGLCFEGYEAWIEQALSGLIKEVSVQILPDGAHISRSPEELLKATQLLLDVRASLAAARYPLPEKIQHALDRMGQALRFFRYADKDFALFHGGQKCDDEGLSDQVMAQAHVKGKPLQGLPCGGYQRLSLGRTLVMFDCGTPAPAPYDRYAHASSLAFEMSYGRERIFVSCGTNSSTPEWQEALRASAAHNMLVIDARNACEIGSDGHIKRRPRKVVVSREENRHACLLEGVHDGYLPLNGITHRRRLYLCDAGNNLRGEENLTCTTGLQRPYEVAVRFHVHPRVMVSLIRDGNEALLRLPSGVGWRFHHAGGLLALENSVYCPYGTEVRKTKQLVIYGQATGNNTKIKWGLQREG